MFVEIMQNLAKYLYISYHKRDVIPLSGLLVLGTFQYLKAMQFLNIFSMNG